MIYSLKNLLFFCFLILVSQKAYAAAVPCNSVDLSDQLKQRTRGYMIIEKLAKDYVDKILLNPQTGKVKDISYLKLRTIVREEQHTVLIEAAESELERKKIIFMYGFIIEEIQKYSRYEKSFENEKPLEKPLGYFVGDKSRFTFDEEDICGTQFDDQWKLYFQEQKKISDKFKQYE